LRRALASVAAAAVLACGTTGTAAAAEGDLDATLQALAVSLDPRVASALAAIEDSGRRLLAARAYLRAGPQLDERWSWSDAEASAFRASPDWLALDADIARVRCTFEAANPGHTLWVNPEFRSLEVQIRRWNENASVGRAGDNLRAALEREFAAAGPGDESAGAGIEALRRHLVAHQPDPVPNLAAPGLSPHGRMRAVDFQVQSQGRIVAGTESASIGAVWISQGWKDRLQAAVASSGAAFRGPLTIPDEPWHYEYRPASGRAAVERGPACTSPG